MFDVSIGDSSDDLRCFSLTFSAYDSELLRESAVSAASAILACRSDALAYDIGLFHRQGSFALGVYDT